MGRKKLGLERVSLVVGKTQHDEILKRDLNFSGLVRDLLDDYFSETSVTLALSEETMQLYRKVISNSGASDQDIEPYFRRALGEMLRDRIDKMKKLADDLERNK